MNSLFISLFFAPDNLPEVTEAIKTVLKDDYNYDSTVRKCFSHFGPGLTDLIFRIPSERSIAPSHNAALSKMKETWCFTRTGMDR